MMDDDGSRAPGRLSRVDDVVVPALRRVAEGFATRFGVRRLSRFGYRHRQLVALAATIVLVGAAAVNYQRFPELMDEARAEAAAAAEQRVRQPGDGSLGGDTLAGGATAIGPIRGTSVDNYLAAIADLPGELASGEDYTAVASFADFVTPEEMQRVLPDGVRAERVQFRLPLDGAGVGQSSGDASDLPIREAEVIAGDIEDSVGNIVDRLLDDIVEEEEGLRMMLETTEEQEFIDDFESRLEELAALRSTLGSGGRILFAVIVRGDAAALRTLASSDPIRALDIAPTGTDTEASEFFGLLPSDQEEITFGQFA